MVADVATGMRRIYEYCYSLEDARARRAYGVPSGVNNVLVINKVIIPGRVTAIIVKGASASTTFSWKRCEQGGSWASTASRAGGP